MATRSQRQVPNLYFGLPGNLVTLPYPLGSIERTAERQTFDFTTGSGLHQVSSLPEASRNFAITWNALYQDTFTKLEQYRLGTMGPGPFAYIDPSAPNLLPANVSGAGSLYADATDLLTITNGGTASANADANFIHRPGGYRSIAWTFPEAPGVLITSPMLYVRSPYRNWVGIPVVAGLPYAFASWIRVDGTIETSASLVLRLEWFNAAGTSLSSNSSSTATVTSTWQRPTVTATAPAGAAFVQAQWILTGSTMAQNGIVYIDEPILEQDSLFNDWAPGTGVRPVQMVGLTESVPFEARFRTNIQMGLRELTR